MISVQEVRNADKVCKKLCKLVPHAHVLIVGQQQVEEFAREWRGFDEFGTGRMCAKYLARLIRSLSLPLGLSPDAPPELADSRANCALMAYLQVEKIESQSGFFGSLCRTHPGTSRKYLEFVIVLKAVHAVANSPDPRSVSEADEFTLRHEFALDDPEPPSSSPGDPAP